MVREWDSHHVAPPRAAHGVGNSSHLAAARIVE